MKRFLAVVLWAGLWAPALVRPCWAEGETESIVQIVLHPAPEPRPALKYRLTVPVIERRPGNAAVLYNRIPAELTWLFSRNEDYWEKLQRWQDAPLSDLRSEEVGRSMLEVSRVFQDLDEAARFETCDWQFPIREQMFWGVLLPEIQQCRAYVRLLAPRIRWQVAEGRYDDAVRSLRSGYSLARNVANGPFVVQCLVGIAIASLMNKQVETFVQQPDAPNLYWALRSLPRPLIDFRPALEAEMDGVYLSFPELRDLERQDQPPEYWQALLARVADRLAPFLSDSKPPEDLRQLATTAAILRGYPRAKQYLVERGRSAAEVDAMPVARVALLYMTMFYDEVRDDLFKWQQLSYAEGLKGSTSAEKRFREMVGAHAEIIPLARALLPAIEHARAAEARVDRDFAALLVLEALRLYAAAHEGRLPDSLADITDVPIPTDPLTGQPFLYRRDGSDAVLESLSSSRWVNLRYRIEMSTKGKQP